MSRDKYEQEFDQPLLNQLEAFAFFVFIMVLEPKAYGQARFEKLFASWGRGGGRDQAEGERVANPCGDPRARPPAVGPDTYHV